MVITGNRDEQIMVALVVMGDGKKEGNKWVEVMMDWEVDWCDGQWHLELPFRLVLMVG